MNKVVVTKKERKKKRKKEDEKWHFCNCTLVFNCLLRGFWALNMSLADHNRTQRGRLGAFSVFVVKLYGNCLSIAYIAHRSDPYIESLLTL